MSSVLYTNAVARLPLR